MDMFMFMLDNNFFVWCPKSYSVVGRSIVLVLVIGLVLLIDRNSVGRWSVMTLVILGWGSILILVLRRRLVMWLVVWGSQLFILYRSLMRKCLLPSRTKEIRKTCIKLFIATKYTTAIGSDMEIDQRFVDNLSVVIGGGLERHQWIDIDGSNGYATRLRVSVSTRACSQKVLRLTTVDAILLLVSWQAKRDADGRLKLAADFWSSCTSQVNAQKLGDITDEPLKEGNA